MNATAEHELRTKQLISMIIAREAITDCASFDRLDVSKIIPQGPFSTQRIWTEFADHMGEHYVSRYFRGGLFIAYNFTLYATPETAVEGKPEGYDYCLTVFAWDQGTTTGVKLFPKHFHHATEAAIAWLEGREITEHFPAHPIHQLLPDVSFQPVKPEPQKEAFKLI